MVRRYYETVGEIMQRTDIPRHTANIAQLSRIRV